MTGEPSPYHKLLNTIVKTCQEEKECCLASDGKRLADLIITLIEAYQKDFTSDFQSAEKVLEPSYDDLVRFARWTQTLWKKGIEIMRENNLVLDDLNDPMQKLAFTFYTDLCEINSEAEHLFQEGWGDKNEKKELRSRQEKEE